MERTATYYPPPPLPEFPFVRFAHIVMYMNITLGYISRKTYVFLEYSISYHV